MRIRSILKPVALTLGALVALAAIIVGVAALTLSAPSGSSSSNARAASSSATLTVVYSESSYAQSFTSLAQMAHAADLVVIGTVGQSSASSAPGGGIQTDFTVHVERVLVARGEANALGGATIGAGSSIDVTQQGGTLGNREIVNTDDPLMKSGERDLFFLHQWGPGGYFTLGGPEGRFILDTHGALHAPNATFHVPDVSDGASLDVITQRVASAG